MAQGPLDQRAKSVTKARNRSQAVRTITLQSMAAVTHPHPPSQLAQLPTQAAPAVVAQAATAQEAAQEAAPVVARQPHSHSMSHPLLALVSLLYALLMRNPPDTEQATPSAPVIATSRVPRVAGTPTRATMPQYRRHSLASAQALARVQLAEDASSSVLRERGRTVSSSRSTICVRRTGIRSVRLLLVCPL